jgi:uncharacterized protein (DUF4213/DUF364 family)
MKILDDLLSTLDGDAAVRDVRQGPFQTAVLTRNGGLASTPHDSGPHHDVAPVSDAGQLKKKGALGLARMAYSASLYEAAIGMATINSLLELDEKRCLELSAGDLLADKGRDKKIALIGHFPCVDRVKSAATSPGFPDGGYGSSKRKEVKNDALRIWIWI